MATNETPDAATGSPLPASALKNDPTVRNAKGLRTGLLMIALCLSVFLAALDVTIITTALPTISTHFGSSSGFVWAGSAFLLAAAASTPNWGRSSDVFGRKPILLCAAAIFFLGSALCGASISLDMLVAGRAVQGAGAGGLLTGVNVIIGDLFSQRERGKYYGIIGMVWAVAAALGPVVGGALTNNVSWRWCFYINLPITGFAFTVVILTLSLPVPKTPFLAGLKAIDWLGSLTLTGGTLMLLIGLQLGGVFHPWASAIVLCLIIFSVVVLLLFAAIEYRIARYPIFPLRLFANLSTVAILLVDFFHGLTFTQVAYFLPLYFQAILSTTPLLSGVYLLPFAISLGLAAVAAGMFLKFTGRHTLCIRVSLALSVLGTGLFLSLRKPPAKMSWARLAAAQVIAGIGVGANFQPPLIALQAGISAQHNAAATAAFGLVRNVASALAVVVGSVAFEGEMSKQRDKLQDVLGDHLAGLLARGNAQGNLFIVRTLEGAAREVVKEALFQSLRPIWIQMVCYAAAGFLASFLIMRKELEVDHVEVVTGLEGEEARRRIAEEHRVREGKAEGDSSV